MPHPDFALSKGFELGKLYNYKRTNLDRCIVCLDFPHQKDKRRPIVCILKTNLFNPTVLLIYSYIIKYILFQPPFAA